jgi:hypothetical protein
MKRIVLASVALIALAWLSGCTSSGGSLASGNTTPSPALLNGQYAFVLSGFDPTNPITMAGSFKADGKGNITAGDVDVNDNGTISSSIALTGNYGFDSLPTGTIGLGTLGTIVLTNTVGSVTHPLKFAFALNSSGTFGSIMDLSTNNFIMAGTMQQQSVFTLAGLAGSYVVTINGKAQINSVLQPTSALGRFTLAAGGTTTNLSFDRSVSGVGTAAPAAATLTFAAAGLDSNGRGTFSLALNDALGSTTQNFAYYAISASRFVAVETDTTGFMMVDAETQSTIPATAVTTGSVFGMAGFDTATSSEIAAAGQLIIPTPGTAGTLAFDSNDNGALNTVSALPTQTVTYNAATGRGTAAIASGVSNGLGNSLVFYLTGASGVPSFIMDNTSGTANRAFGGTLTPQTGVGAFSAATDLPGAAVVRAKGSAVNDAQAFVAEFSLTNTAGSYAFVADQRNAGGSVQDNGISGYTVGSLSATTGRGTLGNGSETLAVYVIGPNQFVFLSLANTASSPLFYATPD